MDPIDLPMPIRKASSTRLASSMEFWPYPTSQYVESTVGLPEITPEVMMYGLGLLSMEVVGACSSSVAIGSLGHQKCGRFAHDNLAKKSASAPVFQSLLYSCRRTLVAAATGFNGSVLSEISAMQVETADHGTLDHHGNATAPGRGDSSNGPRIMFAAGGTGGHVYPATSIAYELQKLHPNVQIEFVGTKDRMEWSAVPKAGYVIRPIPAVGLKRPLLSSANVLLPLKLLISLWASWHVLSKFQPHVVVGTGGYVSGPLCLVAALRACPVVLQEQNAQPGITNKLLGRFAKVVFVAFAAATAFFPKGKCIVSGNPTRLLLERYISTSVARRLFYPELQATQNGQKRGMEVVLILGGSLGAKSINQAVAGMVHEMLSRHPQRYVIWQTGAQYYDEMLGLVGSHARLAIHGFINSMETAYAAADLVVARAGAVTCSELLVAGKPSILIPSLNVTDDHQTRNARSMEQAGAARVLPDKNLSPCVLASHIAELLGNQTVLREMGEKALKLAVPDAAVRIARHILTIARAEAKL